MTTTFSVVKLAAYSLKQEWELDKTSMKCDRASSTVADGGTANNAAAILRSTHDIMYTCSVIIHTALKLIFPCLLAHKMFNRKTDKSKENRQGQIAPFFTNTNQTLLSVCKKHHVIVYTIAPTSKQVMGSWIFRIQLNCSVYVCLQNKSHQTVLQKYKYFMIITIIILIFKPPVDMIIIRGD